MQEVTSLGPVISKGHLAVLRSLTFSGMSMIYTTFYVQKPHLRSTLEIWLKTNLSQEVKLIDPREVPEDAIPLFGGKR